MSNNDRLKRFLRGAGQLSVVICLCSLPISCPAARNANSDSKLVGLVISALDANYSATESARLTMRETVRDLSVEAEAKETTQLPDGRTATVFRSHLKVSTLHLLLRGNDMRCERRAEDSSDGKILEIYGFQDGRWTQVVPSKATAWIRLTDELPSFFPLDPRHFGSPNVRRTIKDVLREDNIVSAKMYRTDKMKVVQVVATSPGGETVTYEFSAAHRFLPTRYYTNWDDGSVLQHVEIGYQPVLDGSALFPSWIRRRFYTKGKTTLAENANWREETLREVVGDIQFNIQIDNESLAVSLPTRTRVVDVSRGKIYGMKDPLRERSSFAVLLNVTVIVVLLGLVVIRSYRSRRLYAAT